MIKMMLAGALGYPALELLWRRRTHYSMAVAGGLAAVMIDRTRRIPLTITAKALLCGLGITGVEYLCGRVWNQKYQVWDYRHTPLNYRGQICLPYMIVWCGLSAAALACLEAYEHRKHPDGH